MESNPAISKRRRVISLTVAALVLLIAAVVGWIGIRGLIAKQELQAINPLVTKIEASVGSGDLGAARTAARQLEAHARLAAGLTDDPLWRAAEVVPLAGANLAAVRQLAAATEAVSSRVVTPLIAVSASVDLEKFKPVGGRLDLAPLVQAAPAVLRAQAALSDVDRSVSAIRTGDTLGVVTDAVTRVRNAINRVSPTITALANSARVLPGMLGADGPRNILLLTQNPAELRATGGLVGSLTLIHTDGGAFSIVAQASTTDFPPLASPVMPLPAATEGLYGSVVGRYVQDVGATPYFPVTAKLAAMMWTGKFGGTIDGVVAIDPVTIQYILKATGPVKVAGGRQLYAGNVVRILLSDSYRDYSAPRAQDAFFASTASAVFSKVASGSADATRLVRALGQAGAERRVLIWSSHPSEQAVFAATTLGGGLPASSPQVAGIGVYFNDATGGKMDYYLKSTVSVATGVCRADRIPTSRVTVSLTNGAPADAGTSLPAYVTGSGMFGVPPGTVRTRVAVYGPKDGLLIATSSGKALYPTRAATDTGRPVSLFTVDLKPGASRTIVVDLLDVAQKAPHAQLTVTPSLGGTVSQNVALACDSTVK
ncbi:DUF4012 domain-containing protein [Diaminobutyricibacter sp. McL0608]|uniref:DUF4012 domain-containing protein n=1 Tax=Leifsonia sp. McL0608 TaxID=3143537 RepID=UPI0031F314CA